jgi:hypothetical protein
MDPNFLKFWGNFLLQAAEGQKRLEELARWMTAGFSGADDLTEMFREAYGLTKSPLTGNDYTRAWEKSAEQFQKALSEYLDLFGAVPRARHEALKKEKAQLAAKVADQANTIQKLRLELGESRAAEGKVFDGFQQLMEVQNEQFRQVSDALGRYFTSGAGQGDGQTEGSDGKREKRKEKRDRNG